MGIQFRKRKKNLVEKRKSRIVISGTEMSVYNKGNVIQKLQDTSNVFSEKWL